MIWGYHYFRKHPYTRKGKERIVFQATHGFQGLLLMVQKFGVHQLICMIKDSSIYRVWYIPGGYIAGCLNHQQYVRLRECICCMFDYWSSTTPNSIQRPEALIFFSTFHLRPHIGSLLPLGLFVGSPPKASKTYPQKTMKHPIFLPNIKKKRCMVGTWIILGDLGAGGGWIQHWRCCCTSCMGSAEWKGLRWKRQGHHQTPIGQWCFF